MNTRLFLGSFRRLVSTCSRVRGALLRGTLWRVSCLVAVCWGASVCPSFGDESETATKPDAPAVPEIKLSPAEPIPPVAPVAEQPKPNLKYLRPVLIRFEGVITPMSQQYLYRKLDAARKQNADLVVIEIESPGGMLGPSLEIAERLRDTKWAHTVSYVPHMALSGAAIMSLGCDEIIMDAHAKFGDAGPIFLNEGAIFQHAPEKIRTHLSRVVHDLAEAKGRPPALAVAMVDKDLVVFRATNKETGQITFMSEHELKSHDKPEQWEQGAPVLESLDGNFLEVSGTRAVELKLAQATAASREELRQRYELANDFVVMQPTAVDTTVYILNRPLITGLLIVIGLIALYIELSAPGISVGGLIATLCFALFFWSRFLGGTSGWLEVVLFLVGAGFVAVEIFVTPGFIVAGLTGLVLMAVSVIMACQDFIVPHTSGQLSTLTTSVTVLAGSGVVFLVAALAISRYLGSIPVFNRMVLDAPAGDRAADDAPLDPKSGKAAALVGQLIVRVGDCGVAESPLRPAGKVRIGDESVDVVTDGSFVTKGSTVRIVEIQGHHIVVREFNETA